MTTVRSHIARLAAIGLAVVLLHFARHIIPLPWVIPAGVGTAAWKPLESVLWDVLFWIAVAVMSYALIRAILFVLGSRGKLGPVLAYADHYGFARALLSDELRVITGRIGLAVKLFSGGVVILLLVLTVASTGSLDDLEATILWPARDGIGPQPVVKIFQIGTPDNNLVTYLRDVLQVSRDFTTAGARVILAQVPFGGFYYGWSLDSAGVIDSTLRTINLENNVVLYYGREPQTGLAYLTQQQGDSTALSVRMTAEIPTGTIYTSPELYRWYPYMQPTPEALKYFPTAASRVDLALVAAGRYLSYPATLRPFAGKGSVRYGSLEIPVTAAGVAYAQFKTEIFPRAFASFISRHRGGAGPMFYETGTGRFPAGALPRNAAAEIEGKIVLLSWTYPDMYSPGIGPWNGGPRAYCQIIESVVAGSYVRKNESLPLILCLAITSLSGILARYARASLAVSVTLLMSVLVMVFGLVEYRSYHVLTDIAYPVLAGILSSVVFPLLRLSHQAREQRL